MKYGYSYPVFVTKSLEKNAYAMGFLPRGKIILVTKGLVEGLNREDFETILLHEVG